MPDDAPAAVLLDYYGTLAHATHWVSADDVLAEHGYELPLETRDRWFNDGEQGTRPRGHLRRHPRDVISRAARPFLHVLHALLLDPDGRPRALRRVGRY